ncbi:MAG: hypothetical protein WCI67_03120 [Chloroflexales bacterium]
MPLLPETLARQLLLPAEGDDLLLATAATGAYARLRTHLAAFLGEKGFDALWRRAIHLARREFQPWADAAGGGPADALPPGLYGALCGDDDADNLARLIAAFASFITLLFTFVGEGLGLSLLHQALPNLPLDAADAQAERATP